MASTRVDISWEVDVDEDGFTFFLLLSMNNTSRDGQSKIGKQMRPVENVGNIETN